ncbi:MAG TPA: efflux transporter outer membrane subunit [Verrucomicrobiales bacterium]|nr:efflux transporter outer membrane subunit [Verrucomicrobiales bacterium]
MNTLRPSLFAVLIPVVLGSCTLDSRVHSNLVAVPVEWRNAGGFPLAAPAEDLSRWWGRFGDPTLNLLIAFALTDSPDINIATARVRESRARRDAEFAGLFPVLDGGASRNSGSTDTDLTGRVSSTSYSAGLDASWQVDLFGRQRSAVQAAAANLGAAEENVHSVHAALAAEIAATYTSLRTNEARLVVLEQNVVTREQTAQLATWREQSGEADSLEASQAQSSLESARAAIPSLEQAIAEDRNQLALLAGREPGAFDALLLGGRGIPDPPNSLAIGIPADALRQRPDVRVAGYQVLAAAANTRAADAARYPALSLSGSLGLNTINASDLFDPETATARLATNLTSPIFDAGRIRANIEAAAAAEQQAIENYRATVFIALAEAENALIACRRSTERLATLEKATQLARVSDELARQRYEAGEIDFLDVLDSQRTLLNLEDNLLSTRTDRTTAYIRLYEALGGGWSPYAG